MAMCVTLCFFLFIHNLHYFILIFSLTVADAEKFNRVSFINISVIFVAVLLMFLVL